MNDILIVNTNKLNFHYHKGFFDDTDEIQDALDDLEYNTDEESMIRLYHKKIKIPRKQVAFGDPGTAYKFSRNTVKAKPWPDFIMDMKLQIENYLRNSGLITNEHHLNYVLVNYYEDGTKYIGWHKDDEKGLKLINGESIIVSVSFGATRDFIFRRDKTKYPIKLKDGDLLIMRGETNKYWEHSLPKRLRVHDPRWNLTFRFL